MNQFEGHTMKGFEGFTPGPWRVGPVMEANARLIAAATDLLAENLALKAEVERYKAALEEIAHPPYGLGFNKLRGIARKVLGMQKPTPKRAVLSEVKP